ARSMNLLRRLAGIPSTPTGCRKSPMAVSDRPKNLAPLAPIPGCSAVTASTIQRGAVPISLIERVAPLESRRSHRVSSDCNRNVLTERRQHKKGKSCSRAPEGGGQSATRHRTRGGNHECIGFLNSRSLIPRLGEAMRRGFGGYLTPQRQSAL